MITDAYNLNLQLHLHPSLKIIAKKAFGAQSSLVTVKPRVQGDGGPGASDIRT